MKRLQKILLGVLAITAFAWVSNASYEERMKNIDEMQTTAVKEKAEAALMRIHPDFDAIRDSDEFHEWADELA